MFESRYRGEQGEVKELSKLADEMGTNMARLALAWCLKNPNVSTVIMGASKVSQLEDNLQALDVVDQISDDLMEKFNALSEEERWQYPEYVVIKHFQGMKTEDKDVESKK